MYDDSKEKVNRSIFIFALVVSCLVANYEAWETSFSVMSFVGISAPSTTFNSDVFIDVFAISLAFLLYLFQPLFANLSLAKFLGFIIILVAVLNRNNNALRQYLGV